jgi:hypothetical protein
MYMQFITNMSVGLKGLALYILLVHKEYMSVKLKKILHYDDFRLRSMYAITP